MKNSSKILVALAAGVAAGAAARPVAVAAAPGEAGRRR